MKIDHASITVRDMDQSLDFYCKTLGLGFVSRREIPENKAEIAFVSGSDSEDNIELNSPSGKVKQIGLTATSWTTLPSWLMIPGRLWRS